MTARERYSRSGLRAAQEVSSRSSAETCRGHRRPLTLACVLASAAALSIPFAITSHAQNAQRGPIQTPGGGRGPGAAPDANDPANAGADLSPKPPVLPLSPQEEAKRLSLPPGYRMEPVLSDPLIEDPAQIAFDGNGRMFVVELRGYFQTPEGIDLIPPIGRISMHEDRDNDGVFERHSVFVDKLVFPRFVMPFGANAILTMETNADEVWKYTDTNGDGVADKKELFATSFGRAGNMESQQASLFWAMDNWLYSTVNAFRLRWTPNGLVKEPTGTEQLAMGRDAGQRRQGLVPGRRQRDARILPVPGPLRELCAAGSIRARPEHRLGRADQDRRHPGGTAGHSHAGWLADLCHGRRRERDLSWRSAAERSRSATICTAKSWLASCDGSGRSRPKASRSCGTSIRAPSSFDRWIRCFARPTSRQVRTARSTSPTCIAA